MVKFIAVKNDITLREIRRADQAEDLDALIAFCKKQSAAATVLSSSDRALYVDVDEKVRVSDESFLPGRLLEVRIRSRQAILTLVGQGLSGDAVAKQLSLLPKSSRPFSFRTRTRPVPLGLRYRRNI